MAENKKNAEDLGAHLVFIDESGFLLIPAVRRTWAPRGQTPICRHRLSRKKVSIISALTVSPAYRHLGLYFRCVIETNFDNVAVADFLRQLLRHLRGFVIVIWDNGRHHRGDALRALLSRYRRLRLEPLPPYAPDLNPDEGIWNQTRTALANSRPDDPQRLTQSVQDVLHDLACSQGKLRWCFHQSEFPIFIE